MNPNFACDVPAGAVAEQPAGALAPESIELYLKLGNALLAQGALAAAAASYRRVLAAQPEHPLARLKLAHVLKLSKNYDAAAEILGSLAAEQPNHPAVHKELGKVHFARRSLDEALECFQHVLRLNPDDGDVRHWLSNIEELRGNLEASQEHFERAIELNPLLRVPASKAPPDFSVLLLFGRGNTNTPPTALVSRAPYDSYFLLLMPGVEYDMERLQGRANLVVNLISDVDQGREVLPLATKMVERLGLPVVNPPRAILKTGRDTVATLLSGIARCRVPRVRHYEHNELTAAMLAGLLDDHPLPLLARVAGAHGGHDFEKVEDFSALAGFVGQHPRAGFYLSEYIDYRSADGLFRKYRFIFIADEMLPYHLAIDDKWKVHHYTTDMANQPWMQREEAAFLDNPASVFGPEQLFALRSIQQAIGLDFFGIDCGIDREGNVVVFEVNAAMLVHRDNASFAYKTAHVDRIKRAFDAMLGRMAIPD